MRLLLSLGLLVSSLVAACADGCTRPTACEGFPVVTDACGWWELEGETVCGCSVTVAAEGEPFCTRPDPRAPMSVSWISADDPERYFLGTWPDLSSLDADACPDAAELATLGDTVAQAGSIDLAVDDQERDWAELTWSPRGDMAAVYERLAPGYERGATLLRCQDGDDPGWAVERFLDPVTSPFIRWGVQQGESRDIYLMLHDFYRVRVNVEPRLATPQGGGEEAEIVVIEEAELLAHSETGNLAFGDLDVGFDTDASGEPRDRFAIYMSGMDASYFPLYAEAAMYLTDLADCVDDCGEERRFCCRTAFLTQGNSDAADIPTNPGISDDGSLLVFNRFTSTQEQCPEWALCAQEHVLKNPFLDEELFEAHCVQDESRDGFIDAIDCSALFETDGAWDDTKCPDHQCCGEGGVDCSTCVTFGEQPEVDNACGSEGEGVRERNYVVFFDNGGDTWIAFRSADLLGDMSEQLHVYRIGFDDNGDFLHQGTDDVLKIPMANFEGAAMDDFGPGPWRRLPGEASCE